MNNGKYIDVVFIHENGETKVVIENGPAIKCGDLPTDELIKKLMGTSVPGFGSSEIVEEGHTSEYYEDKKPVPSAHQEEGPTFVQRRKEQEQKQEGRQFQV